MSTSKLLLYNGALTLCGERHITLAENRESRRLLDEVWDNGAVDDCLESAQWKFAMRSVRIDYDTDITPDFGYERAFLKPADWLLTSAVCQDEFFNTPLLQYVDESGYWYSSLSEIYVKYVSNDSLYGGDYGVWPSKFVKFVKAYLASEIIFSLSTSKTKREEVTHYKDVKLFEAKNKDAMGDPQKFPPAGAWASSRRRNTQGDRGSRSNLTG